MCHFKKGENKVSEKLNDPNKENGMPEIYVVQRYLQTPYLIGGKKFDMRIYVLVTSVSDIRFFGLKLLLFLIDRFIFFSLIRSKLIYIERDLLDSQARAFL